MRNLLLGCLLLVCLQSQMNAQFEFGIKGGLSSVDLISDGIKVDDGINHLQLDFVNSAYGHHLGLYSRVSFLGIYLEPAALFNSNMINYRLTDYSEDGVLTVLFREKYYSVDIPLMVGIKAGIFRLYGGPVAHMHISSTSDLTNFSNYGQKFRDASYGYQAGFGFDIWKLRLEVAYEGNLSAFGDHITIDGQPYNFGQSASRVLGSVGYKF
ncbi:MAG: outer membrane beta-barrel protein [Saprospiraceae bacterium]|nr:outer membrane beta-barrel protein [Saprospiraceae bacterium]